MMIFDQASLFLGCSEQLKEEAEMLSIILQNDSSLHSIVSCLASMATYARADLVTQIAAAEDNEGVANFIGDSLSKNMQYAETFKDLAHKHIKACNDE